MTPEDSSKVYIFKHIEIKNIYPHIQGLTVLLPILKEGYKITHNNEEIRDKELHSIFKAYIPENDQAIVFTLLEIFNYNVLLLEKSLNAGLIEAKEQNLPEDYDFGFTRGKKDELVH